LAPEDGTVEFDTGLLGGRSARLLLAGGGHYYFAHFIDWNDREFSNGDEVHRGDVIGLCGDTGNATVAHVHFGWYDSDGVAIDPMRRLIRWLREAEADLPALLSEARLGGAATVSEMLGSAEPSFDVVRALLEGRLAESRFSEGMTASGTGSRGALDLTPVLLFLMLFSLTGRRTASDSSPPRGPTIGVWSRSAWEDRRGRLLA
jgi:hypothetical protein